MENRRGAGGEKGGKGFRRVEELGYRGGWDLIPITLD